MQHFSVLTRPFASTYLTAETCRSPPCGGADVEAWKNLPPLSLSSSVGLDCWHARCDAGMLQTHHIIC